MDKIDQERVQEQINIFNEETSKHPLLMDMDKIDQERLQEQLKTEQWQMTFQSGVETMNELTRQNNTLMSVVELANTLSVDKTTITRAINKLDAVLHPLLKNSQGGYLINEKQATLIKQEIQSHHNLTSRQIDSVTTEQEETEIIMQAMSILKRKHDEYKQRAELAESKLEEEQPKIEFANAVLGCSDVIDIGSVAKTLHKGVGRNKLFEILRNKKILQPNNIPYQTYIDRGYFRTIEQRFTKPDGSTHISIKTVVYQKGVKFISKVLDQEK